MSARANPSTLREQRTVEYLLFLQRNMPEGVSAEYNEDLYQIWQNAVVQSHDVFEAAFDLQHIIDIYEFSEIPRAERPEWLRGVPMMVKVSTREIYEGDEIMEEFQAYIANTDIEQTIGDDGMANSMSGREKNETYLDDPTWNDAVQDDGDDEDDANFKCTKAVPPSGSSIPIRTGNEKVSEQDDTSYADRRKAFLQRHIGRDSESLARFNARQAQQQKAQQNQRAKMASSMNTEGRSRMPIPMATRHRPANTAAPASAGPAQRHAQQPARATETPLPKTVVAPKYQPPQADINPRYDVPLGEHPLFQSPITPEVWATLNEGERTEVHRVISRLQNEDGVQIPEQLAMLLEADGRDRRTRAAARRPVFSGERVKEEPSSTFVATKRYKMLDSAKTGSTGQKRPVARKGVAPKQFQFQQSDSADADMMDVDDAYDEDEWHGGDAMSTDDATFADVSMQFL